MTAINQIEKLRLGPSGLFAVFIACALPVAALWFTGKMTYGAGRGHAVWLLGDDRLSCPPAGSMVHVCGEEDRQTHVVRGRTISLIRLSGGY